VGQESKDVDSVLKERHNDEDVVQWVRKAISRDLGGCLPMLVEEILDLALPQVWKPLPPMLEKRVGLGGTSVDGKLCAIGGVHGLAHMTGEFLDLKNMGAGWKRLPKSVYRGHLGLTHADGKLYAIGGRREVNHYDYMNNDFEKIAEFLDLRSLDAGWKDLPPMRTGRAFFGLVHVDGKLYAIGGLAGFERPLRSGEFLNLKNIGEGWKELPPLTNARYRFGVIHADGKLFAIGGDHQQHLRDHSCGECLDLKNMAAGWKQMPLMCDLPRRRNSSWIGCAESVVYDNGKLIAVLGCFRSMKQLDLNNVRAGWHELTPKLDHLRRNFAMVCENGKLFVFGGDLLPGGACRTGQHLRISM